MPMCETLGEYEILGKTYVSCRLWAADYST